jgi:hypothetical protein
MLASSRFMLGEDSQEQPGEDDGPQDDGSVGSAARAGIAEGLRKHLPDGVGIVLLGIPIFGFATYCHFVLGISVSGPRWAAGVGGAAVAAFSVWQKRDR